MVRHRRDLKAAKTNEVQRIEHSEIFDDNLLPEASEIEKLSRIDPNIIDWLKYRAEKEQDFRHDSYAKRLKLVDEHNQREHNTTRMALIIYFLLVGGCLTAAYFLVRDGHNTQGSIFGGAAVVLAFAVLVTRVASKQSSEKKDKDDKKEIK